jgi:hypothetical protein
MKGFIFFVFVFRAAIIVLKKNNLQIFYQRSNQGFALG